MSLYACLLSTCPKVLICIYTCLYLYFLYLHIFIHLSISTYIYCNLIIYIYKFLSTILYLIAVSNGLLISFFMYSCSYSRKCLMYTSFTKTGYNLYMSANTHYLLHQHIYLLFILSAYDVNALYLLRQHCAKSRLFKEQNGQAVIISSIMWNHQAIISNTMWNQKAIISNIMWNQQDYIISNTV